MSEDNIEMRIMAPGDADKVIQFLLKHFYPDVPLGDKNRQPKTTLTPEEIDSIRRYIDSECSIMAVETSNDGGGDGDVVNLVGITLALPRKKSSIDKYFQDAEKAGNTVDGQLSRLLGIINREAKAFERYNTEELLYLSISAVSSDRRGKNLAARMTQELIKVGKSKNFKAMTVDCASFYCAQVCERLGMDFLASVDYKAYVDDEGKPIFDVDPPHMTMKTYGISL